MGSPYDQKVRIPAFSHVYTHAPNQVVMQPPSIPERGESRSILSGPRRSPRDVTRQECYIHRRHRERLVPRSPLPRLDWLPLRSV